MKSNVRFLFLAFLCVPFIFLSCVTTDKSLLGPPDEDSLSALAQARANAEESRGWADYANGKGYFPNEWDIAEERYNAAGERSEEPETKGEALTRATEWTGIKVLYDDIFNKSAPQFAPGQQRTIAEARNKAVGVGAEALVPERFALADDRAASSRQKFEKADFGASVKEGKEAQDRYLILQTLAAARARQEEADEYEFFYRDEESYIMAADAGNTAVDLYDEGDLAESRAQADAALAGFNQVLKDGVEEMASEAKEWRTASQDVKANVAVRSDFTAAEQAYNDAHAALRAEQYAKAIDLFDQSGELFMIAHDKALAKRERAEEAIQKTEQKLAESEEKAQNAKDVIGGGE